MDTNSGYFRTEGAYNACYNGALFNQPGLGVCNEIICIEHVMLAALQLLIMISQ